MSELVVINSTFLKRDTTHVVICEGSVEVVAEFAGGGQRQVIEVKSTTWRHEDYAAFPGHVYKTFSVREKKMREGIDLGTYRPA